MAFGDKVSNKAAESPAGCRHWCPAQEAARPLMLFPQSLGHGVVPWDPPPSPLTALPPWVEATARRLETSSHLFDFYLY